MKFTRPFIPLTTALVIAIVLAIAGVILAILLHASQDFIEKYIFLLATASITGFIVPYILKIIDDRKMRDQKRYEDDLARQNKIIDAQVQFLENISKLLWEFHALIARVSYYQKMESRGYTVEIHNGDKAISAYENRIWDVVIIGLQSEINKSRRLISVEAYQKLKALYKEVVIGLDQEVVRLIARKASPQEWARFHDEDLKGYLVVEIENTLLMLAEDMKLARKGNTSMP